MSDFSNGKLWKGLLLALINGIIFIAIPVWLKSLNLSYSGVTIIINEDFLNKWLYCGIPITIISFFTGFYEKGNISKVYATGLQVIIVIVSLFYIFGTDVDDIAIIHTGTTVISVGLAIAGMLVAISISKCLKFVIAYVDYIDYRKEFREKADEKDGKRKNKLLEKMDLIDEEQK